MYYKVTLWKEVKQNDDTKQHFKEIVTFAEKQNFGITDYNIVSPQTVAPQYQPAQEAPEAQEQDGGEPQ